jgi:hypothetical protein
MNVSDVVFEMELAGVDAADIDSIVSLCESKGFDSDFMDEELLKRGYPKIFTIDYDEYDDFEDDEYMSVEKFRHKHQYMD